MISDIVRYLRFLLLHEMEKKCIIIDTSESARDVQPPINRALCLLICQSNKPREKLQWPGNALQSGYVGYESLGKILPEFKKLGLLPVHLLVLSVCR